MTVPRAILLGSFLVALSVTASLGYRVYHDHREELLQQERQRAEANRAYEALKQERAKVAWYEAVGLLRLHLELKHALDIGTRLSSGLDYLTVSTFQTQDVVFTNHKLTKAVIHGHATWCFEKCGGPEKWFTWTSKMELPDDGIWRAAKPEFEPFTVPNEKDFSKTEVVTGGQVLPEFK